MGTPDDPESLADWRRQVSELYARVRMDAAGDPARAWDRFRSRRDQLFKRHPQTPLSASQVESFTGLDYFPYDPSWRLIGQLDRSMRGETQSLELGEDGTFHYRQIGKLRIETPDGEAGLPLYWIESYAGGLFLPFLDGTSGETTYGGGRYLLDTCKGADLGADGDGVVLDFNFAYNPSCAYHSRWLCPLAPPESRLPFSLNAGEKVFR